MNPNVMSAIISSKSNSGLNNTGSVVGFSLMFVAGVEFIIAMTRSLKQGVVSHDLIFTLNMLRDRYEGLIVEYSGVFLTFSMTCLRLSDLVTHWEFKHDNILSKRNVPRIPHSK